MERSALARCDIVSVGSLLETALRHGGSNRPVVWGSGFLQPRGSVSTDALTCAAVRGRLTRARISSSESLALGDPGLLVNLLVDRPPPRRDRIGFLPHRHDRTLASVLAFAERPEVDLLDIRAHPLDVVRAIASCRFVLSSSLHGLIVADAYGVPSAWVEPSSQVEGAGYKFRDYYSVFDMEPPRVKLADWPSAPWPWVEEREATWARTGIDDLRAGLLDALRGSGI